MTLLRATVLELYWPTTYGSAMGTAAAFVAGARAIAPVAASGLFNITGNYRALVWTLSAVVVLAALCMNESRRALRDP